MKENILMKPTRRSTFTIALGDRGDYGLTPRLRGDPCRVVGRINGLMMFLTTNNSVCAIRKTRSKINDANLQVIEEFKYAVVPRLDELEKGVIHGDVNDMNVLVAKKPGGGLVHCLLFLAKCDYLHPQSYPR